MPKINCSQIRVQHHSNNHQISVNCMVSICCNGHIHSSEKKKHNKLRSGSGGRLIWLISTIACRIIQTTRRGCIYCFYVHAQASKTMLHTVTRTLLVLTRDTGLKRPLGVGKGNVRSLTGRYRSMPKTFRPLTLGHHKKNTQAIVQIVHLGLSRGKPWARDDVPPFQWGENGHQTRPPKTTQFLLTISTSTKRLPFSMQRVSLTSATWREIH